MTKTTIIIVLAFLVIISLSVIINLSGGKKGQAKKQGAKLDKVSVRLKWIYTSQSAGFFVADKKGFYEDNGIDITLNPGGIDFPAILMVTKDKEQFGVTGAPQLLMAKEKDIPLVALMTIFRKDPGVLISLKETNIKEPKNLIGKKVGVEYGTSTEQVYRSMMKNAGINKSKVIEVPQRYDYSSLLSGKIDASWYWAMGNLLLENKDKFNIIWPSDYGVNFYADVLFTTEGMVKNNPDLVKRFVKATLRGWRYAYDNPEEAASYALMYSDQLKKEQQEKYMQTSLKFLKPDDKPIGYMDKKAWEDMQKALLDGGFMKKAINIDEVYNDQFLE